MFNSILKQALATLPCVALATTVFCDHGVARAQSVELQDVDATLGDDDASLFDSHLVDQPPPGAACLPGFLSPDRVFTPPEPSPLTPSPDARPAAPSFMNQPQLAALPAGQGALTAQSYVPAMVGDFFGGPATTISSGESGGLVVIPRSSGVGVMKFAENTSPLPRDRVFVNYSYFNGVDIVPGGATVNRVTPGIEKTFFDGMASLEFRAPMAWTANSTTPFDVNSGSVIGYDSNHFELGNMTMFLKTLLYQDETFAFTSGLGITLPTADDIRVVDPQLGATLDVIRNKSVHLLPFIGSIYTPNDRWYVQNTWQIDVPLNGNTVYTTNFDLELEREGVLDDPLFLFGSIGTGYWIYVADDPTSHLSRMALLAELHFNRTLKETDAIRGNNADIGTRVDIQTVNAVVGTNFLIDNNKSLILGYVAPIGGGNDRAFDGEVRVIFNWYFGGSLNRASGVQF